MKVDLMELAKRADVDPRSITIYFSAQRERMKPRVRARIERAEAEMKKSPSEGPLAV